MDIPGEMTLFIAAIALAVVVVLAGAEARQPADVRGIAMKPAGRSQHAPQQANCCWRVPTRWV
jgi:hypothetical protein